MADSTAKQAPSYAGVVNAPEFPQGMAWLNTERPLTLKALRGKIVLLDFWTYCCINCMHVLPDLKRLEHEFPELVVVGVHSAKFQNEQDAENIRNAILRYDIEHPVAVDNDFYLWQQYAIKAWPSFALIDPNGKVVGTTSGEGVYDQLQPVLAAMRKQFESVVNKERLSFQLERAKTGGALLSYPGKITADAATHRLFFTDSNHNRVVVMDAQGNILEVIGSGMSGQADGGFAQASFFRPQGLAYDAAADALYIADTDNHLIRKADFKTKQVTTLLGTGQQARTYAQGGTGRAVAINSPWDVQLLGGKLYIAMAGPHQLWVLDPATLQAKVYAGSGHENITDGPLLQAALAQPSGITTDGTQLYFADSEVSAIRAADATQVRTLIGEGLFAFGDVDGAYPKARLQHCIGVHYHNGALLVADTYNHKIRKLDPATRTLTTWLGTGKRGSQDGDARTAQFNEPNDITFLDGKYYITDTNNALIRVYDEATGRVSTLELKDTRRLSMLEVKRKADGAGNNSAAVPFFGQVVTLAPQPAPTQTVQIKIDVPKGYELNTDAPNYLSLTTDNGAASQPLDLKIAEGSLLATIPAAQVAGATRLTLEAGIYYCEHGRRARCLIKMLQVVAPIKAGSAPVLTVAYALPSPA
jgi:DNA-binding beta-propeller fold protein YncE